jgi:acyl carrier protein
MERSRILGIVYEVMKELNEGLEDEKKLELNENTKLFGSDSNLDSIGLVNLIVGVEQRILDELGIEMDLTDEKAMSQVRSPFKTVSSLVDYICSLGG